MRWPTFQRASFMGRPRLHLDALLPRATPGASWLVVAMSLTLFVATMSRDLTWRNYSADGGELMTASMTLGVAHPPGYPLYIVIGRLFGLLPLGTVAARFALLSAVAAAAAIGLAVRCMTVEGQNKGGSTAAALATGLALAVSPLVWGQAIVAEVYALFLFFVALFAWAILSDKSPLAIGLTLGLAVTAHLTGLLLLPLAIWKARSNLARFAVGAAVGLSPFLWLPLLATGPSPLVWGDPDSLGGWWWLVSAQLYRPNVFGLAPSQYLARLARWLNPTVLAPLLLWLGTAFLVAWRSRRDSDKSLLVLTFTALLFAVYAFTYAPKDSAVLLLPALLLAAVVVGRDLVQRDQMRAWLLPLLMLILALAASPAASADRLRADALSSLAQVPAQAVVLTPGDATVSVLWYLHHVEDVRPDITIVDQNMFQFEWYRDRIRRLHPSLWVPAADDLAQFISQNRLSRPVCWLSLADEQGNPDGCLPVLEASFD